MQKSTIIFYFEDGSVIRALDARGGYWDDFNEQFYYIIKRYKDLCNKKFMPKEAVILSCLSYGFRLNENLFKLISEKINKNDFEINNKKKFDEFDFVIEGFEYHIKHEISRSLDEIDDFIEGVKFQVKDNGELIMLKGSYYMHNEEYDCPDNIEEIIEEYLVSKNSLYINETGQYIFDEDIVIVEKNKKSEFILHSVYLPEYVFFTKDNCLLLPNHIG